jgi:endonuclease YncB( thermonuclease family)
MHPASRRLVLLFALPLGAALATRPAAGDWLVYLGGGVQETRGGWQVRGPLVRFNGPAGTLFSVRSDEVDLAASAFLSWQVGDRRAIDTAHLPAGAELHRGGDPAHPAKPSPCVAARVVQVLAAETLEIEIGGRTETVHLAGIDAPETQHRYEELAWFGREAAAEVEAEIPRLTRAVCVADEAPPLVDRAGHRIVYVSLPNGGDLGEDLLLRGLALARSGDASRHDHYLEIERIALASEVGLWGDTGHDHSTAIVAQASAFGASPAARPAGRRS